jgi:hypothetical protein
VASTRELAAELRAGSFGAVVHQGSRLGVYLSPFALPSGPWIGLVVFGPVEDELNASLRTLFGR